MAEIDWLARFEEHLVGLSMAPATISNYLADIRSFSDWLPDSRLSNSFLLGVDGDHVRRYCQSLRLQGRSASTINRRLQAVRKFYDFAVQMGWASHNPAREVDRFSERPAVPPRILTGDEARRLLRAIGDGMDSISRRDRAIVGLLLDTGLKVGELVSLRMDDLVLDVGNGHIFVGQDLQTGGRCLRFGPETCAALRSYLRVRAPAQRVDHLFVSRRGLALAERTVQRLVSNYARKAELEGVSAQTLRYTFAHDVLEENDLSEVARMLGLRDAADARRYA
jgi:integrase/recombinase XerC